MLPVQLWNGPGPHLGLEMRTPLLLLGAWIGSRRRTQTPPDPDHGGTLLPPRRPAGCQAREPRPAGKVWGRLGLREMPIPASIGHSRASLRDLPSPAEGASDGDEEPLSPLAPRNLFGPREEDSTI